MLESIYQTLAVPPTLFSISDLLTLLGAFLLGFGIGVASREG